MYVMRYALCVMRYATKMAINQMFKSESICTYAYTIFKQLRVRKIGSLRVAIHASSDCIRLCHNDVNCSLYRPSKSEVFLKYLTM